MSPRRIAYLDRLNAKSMYAVEVRNPTIGQRYRLIPWFFHDDDDVTTIGERSYFRVTA
jgi:hypothetical protein